MDQVLKSLWPSVHFHRIIHTEEKVFSVTFVESITVFYRYHPNYHHLTPKADQNALMKMAHQKRYCDTVNCHTIVWRRIIEEYIPKPTVAS
jgi:hypothetical protein